MIKIIENAFNLLRDPIIVASAGVLAWQAVKAVRNYKGQRKEIRLNRSAEWASHIREVQTWDQIHETLNFFRQVRDDKKKIDYMNDPSNRPFRVKVFRVLSLYEIIGYLYNSGNIDKDFVRRCTAGTIIEYWDESWFWVDHHRTEAADEHAWEEFEGMVKDLRKRTQLSFRTN